MAKPTISVYHDTRRALSDGSYPVKIRAIFRVVDAEGGARWVTKYFGDRLSCPVLTFGKLWASSARLTEEQKTLRRKIDALHARAKKIAEDNEGISPDDFEAEFLGIARNTVNAIYAMKIADLMREGFEQVSSARSYESSLASLTSYREHLKKPGDIRFPELTSEWLSSYEEWMISQKATINTIGIYLRNLRHIFNLARGVARMRSGKIKVIPMDLYPFDEYQIKTERKYKIPLSDAELKKVKDFESDIEELNEARDYFIFSYYCNGMNLADVLKLRHSDITEDFLVYDRKKTRKTRKQLKAIIIPLDHPEIREIIKRRGAKTLDPNGLVFPVLDDSMTEVQIKDRVGDFIKKTNASLHVIAGKLSIKKNLTTVIARHTYANRILNSTDGDVRMIQDALGHSSVATSEHYKGTLYLKKIKKVRKAL